MVATDSSFEIGPDQDIQDTVEASIREAKRYWGTNAEKTLYWGTSNVSDSIEPGMYKCITTEQTGYTFSKLIIETDELIQLPDMVCNEVIDQIQQFWSPEVRAAMKKRGFLHKRGILMFGEPGSGKTCTIQILVQSLIKMGGIALFAEDPQILTGCLQLLRQIERDRPVIVLLEDFDTLTNRDTRENSWLSVLDGEAQIANVVYMATTNYIEKLDKRFVDRPSRFDLVVPVPMPTAKARAAYLRYKEPELSDEELFEWVQASDGYSIAHLKEMALSIMCYGKTLEETTARLTNQRTRKFSNDDLEKEAMSNKGIGFTRDEGPIKKFESREHFDKFLADELSEWKFEI